MDSPLSKKTSICLLVLPCFLILFTLSDSQYKYHFKKWGWKKSVSLAKKEAIVKATQTRASAGKSTVATVQGREVDKKKLRRHLKSSIRQSTKNIASSMAMDVDRSLGMYSGPSFILGDSMYVTALLILTTALIRLPMIQIFELEPSFRDRLFIAKSGFRWPIIAIWYRSFTVREPSGVHTSWQQ